MYYNFEKEHYSVSAYYEILKNVTFFWNLKKSVSKKKNVFFYYLKCQMFIIYKNKNQKLLAHVQEHY